MSAADVGAYTLAAREPGLSYRLEWEEADAFAAWPGTVCIEVRAAALNYRDIMQVNGLLPAEAVEGTLSEAGLGLECAGVIGAVGEGVDGFEVGDRVFALAPRSLASHTVTPEHVVGRTPEHMSFAEAATLPVVCATVEYALGTVAGLSPGESVLVHGGAGGVGLATLQFARERGGAGDRHRGE